MTYYDLEIVQGSDYSLDLTLKDPNGAPIDLTSYSISGYLKFKYSDSSILSNLNAVINNPASSGAISLSIPNTGTSALPITIGFYDVEISGPSGLGVSKVLMGKARIYPEATY